MYGRYIVEIYRSADKESKSEMKKDKFDEKFLFGWIGFNYKKEYKVVKDVDLAVKFLRLETANELKSLYESSSFIRVSRRKYSSANVRIIDLSENPNYFKNHKRK